MMEYKRYSPITTTFDERHTGRPAPLPLSLETLISAADLPLQGARIRPDTTKAPTPVTDVIRINLSH
jgi:hypothetical protein